MKLERKENIMLEYVKVWLVMIPLCILVALLTIQITVNLFPSWPFSAYTVVSAISSGLFASLIRPKVSKFLNYGEARESNQLIEAGLDYANVVSQAELAIDQSKSFEKLLPLSFYIDRLLIDYLKFVMKRENIPNWEYTVDQIIKSEEKAPVMVRDRDRSSWAHSKVFKASQNQDTIAKSLINIFEYDKTTYDKVVMRINREYS